MDLLSDRTPDSLRAHAALLEQGADEKLRLANVEADEMRRRAHDYRLLAADLDAHQQPSTCRACNAAIVRDSLGWKHTTDTTCMTPAPVEQPAEQVAS